jgi:hypothetical protein
VTACVANWISPEKPNVYSAAVRHLLIVQLDYKRMIHTWSLPRRAVIGQCRGLIETQRTRRLAPSGEENLDGLTRLWTGKTSLIPRIVLWAQEQHSLKRFLHDTYATGVLTQV